MKHLRKYIRLLVEQTQDEKLITLFLDNAAHGLHLAQSIGSPLAEEFEELRENALFLIELVEDKSNLQVWGGYQYQDQQAIYRVGRQIQDDLLHLPGVTDDHPLWKIVRDIHMGCTNKAKSDWCIDHTESLKDWVGAA